MHWTKDPTQKHVMDRLKSTWHTDQPKTDYPKTCGQCGKDFISHHKRGRFCSRKCADNWDYNHNPRDQNRARKKAHERNLLIGSCGLCGTELATLKTPRQLGMKWYAGNVKFMRDHIVPKAAGGTDDPANIRHICWYCNLARKDMDQRFDLAVALAGRAFWGFVSKLPADIFFPNDRPKEKLELYS
jgi:hypothetical protein